MENLYEFTHGRWQQYGGGGVNIYGYWEMFVPLKNKWGYRYLVEFEPYGGLGLFKNKPNEID